MSWNEDLWKWIKSAPLPVVLIVSVLSGVGSVTYTQQATSDAKKEAAEAKDKAKEAEGAAKKAEEKAEDGKRKLDEIGKDVKDLLRVVGELTGEVRAARKSKE